MSAMARHDPTSVSAAGLPAGMQARLRAAGIQPTLQRLAVAEVLLARPQHMTADQVLAAAQRLLPGISRATVYAVLQLFTERGLLRELPVTGAATIYDSNTDPHHHLVDVETGDVLDLPAEALQVTGLAEALRGVRLDGVDVIVRVRGLAGRQAPRRA